MLTNNNQTPFIWDMIIMNYIQTKRNTSPWGSICWFDSFFSVYFQTKRNTNTFKVNATRTFSQLAFTLTINFCVLSLNIYKHSD